jgi:hypothetical protein
MINAYELTIEVSVESGASTIAKVAPKRQGEQLAAKALISKLTKEC